MFHEDPGCHHQGDRVVLSPRYESEATDPCTVLAATAMKETITAVAATLRRPHARGSYDFLPAACRVLRLPTTLASVPACSTPWSEMAECPVRSLSTLARSGTD